MATPLRKPATYEDLIELADDRIGEIVDGELYASPRPSGPHASCAFELGLELGEPFRRGRGGPGGWLFLFEPELRLGSDTLVPDLAGWRRERMAAVPDGPALTLAPDWVCEILSRFDRECRSGPQASGLRTPRRRQRLARQSQDANAGGLPARAGRLGARRDPRRRCRGPRRAVRRS